MNKIRYNFFYMVILCLGGVHGPAKSVWAGLSTEAIWDRSYWDRSYLGQKLSVQKILVQKLLAQKLLGQKLFGTEAFGTGLNYTCHYDI